MFVLNVKVWKILKGFIQKEISNFQLYSVELSNLFEFLWIKPTM